MTETGMTEIENSLFSEMEVAIQESILSKTVIFQGKKIFLKDLLTPSRSVDFDEVIDSELLTKLDNNEEISIGTALNNEIPCYYLSRKCSNDNEFSNEPKEISDDQMCYIKESPWHQTVTIYAPAGSGKSTLLDYLAVIIKKRYPHLWIIKIDLNDYTDALSQFKKNNAKLVTVMDLLNSRPQSGIKEGLERKVFSIRQKVVLLIDGLDEVSPDFEEIVTDIMSNYKDHRCFAKVFVMSSENLSKKLQGECWSQTPLIVFSEEDKENLFETFLEHKLDGLEDIERRIFVKELLRKIGTEKTLIGDPLKLKMLAEIYEDQVKWKDYYEFLTYDSEAMVQQINLSKLYLLFLHKKYSKKETSLDEDNLRKDITNINKECGSYLYVIALENIFPKERCQLFNVYRNVEEKIPKDIEEKLCRMGMVRKVNGFLRFFHRTVAEYFVAECVAEELCNNSDRDFLVYFIKEILTRRLFSVILSFLDSIISTYINSIPDENLKTLGSILPDNEIILFDLIKHSYINIFNLIVKCIEIANIEVDFDVIRSNGKTLLQAAISAGRADLLEFLVEKGVSVDSRDDTDRTALYDAVSNNNLDAVKFLAQHGLEVHCRDLNGRTPLHEAGASSSVDIVEYLLTHGAVIDSKDRQGFTCLHEAAKSGDLAKVKYLVENGADVDGLSNGGTPILEAAKKGHVDVITYFIEKGANLILKDKSGISVLHEPYYDTKTIIKTQDQKANIFKIIKKLLESGADVNAVDNRGNTVLHSHIDGNDMKDLVELLVGSGANTEKINKMGLFPLDKAIQNGAFDTVKYLMEKGATRYCRNTFFVAVRKGYLPIVKYLVENGADLNVQNQNRETPLLTAACSNNIDMIRFFVENGADVNAETKGMWSETVLKRALTNNRDLNVVKYLVEKGANTNGTLNTAAYRGNVAVVKYLLSKGATEKEICEVGDDIELLKCFEEKGIKVNLSYLFYNSASTGNLDIIRYALDKGVDVNYKNNLKTALHEAAKQDHLHIVKFLVKRGARIDIEDIKYETPVDKAVRHRNMEVADFLEQIEGKGVEQVYQKIVNGRGNTYSRLLFVLKRGLKINASEKPHNQLISRWLGNDCFELPELLIENNIGPCKTVVDVVKQFVESKDDELLDQIFRYQSIVKGLLERGLQIDVKIMEKYDFLIKMASADDLKLVKFLVETGMDVNKKDVDGNTALHKASSFRIVKYLVKTGADVKAKNNTGLSVLHCAVENKNLDICKFLTENGASIDTECNNGHSLLYTAATKGSFTKLKYFVKKGAKLSEIDSNIVLHDVMKFNDSDLVKYLIENGAHIEGKDSDGRTALYKAVERNNIEIVQYLVASGANVKVEDSKSVTLYQWASDKSSKEIVKFLASNGARFKRKSKNK